MAKRLIYEIEVVTTSLKDSDRSIQTFIDRNKQLQTALKDVPEQGTAAYNELDARIRKASNGTETLKDRVDALGKEYAENRNAIRDFNRELNQGEKAVNSINSLRNQVIALNRELDNTEIGSTRFRQLTRESAEATNRLKDLEQQTLRFQRNVGNYQSIGQGIINTFKQVGKTLLAAFTIDGLVNLTQRAVGDLVQTARDYSQAIATVGAVSGASEEGLAKLSAEARRLGETTAFSATSAAEGMVELSRAGFTVEEQLAATESVLNLATAGNVELSEAASLASIAIRSYKLEAEDAGRVTDIIAKTFNTSLNSLETYGEAFKVIAPNAADLNIPLEELSATIGTLGNEGKLGTEATTALRTSLARLAAQPTAVKKELDRLNVSAFDQQGQFVGLAGLLEQLEDRYENFTDQQRTASLSQIFGNRAISQASILLNAQKEVVTENGTEILKGADALRAYTAEIEAAGESAGEFTANLAEQQLDSFEGDIVLLQSATEGLQLALFDLVEDNLRGVVQGVRAVVTELSQFAQGQGELAEFIERNGTAIRVIAILFGTYTAAVVANTLATRVNTLAQQASQASLTRGSAVSKAAAVAKVAYTAAVQVLTGQMTLASAASTTFAAVQTAVNAALAANPIGAVVLAIGALVAGLVAAYRSSEDFRATVAGIGAAFEEVWNRVQPVLSAIGNLIAEVFQVGLQIARTYFNFVVGFWTTVLQAVGRFVTGTVNALRGVAGFVSGVFRNMYQAAVNFLQPIISIFDPFVDRVQEIFGQVYEAVTGVFSDIKDAVVETISGVFEFFGIDLEGVNQAFEDVRQAATDAANGAGAAVGESFNKGFNRKLLDEFADEMKEAIEEAAAQGTDYDLEPAKRRIAEALSKGIIQQEDADSMLRELQNAVNKSDEEVTTDVGVDPTALDPDALAPDAPGGPSAAEQDAFKQRLESYQKQAAELEQVQLRLSERGLEILRAQRLRELAEDEAFQALRAEEQIRILQDIETEYTEARLKLAQDRQNALSDERAEEVARLTERSVVLRQITNELGVEEVENIRLTSTESLEAIEQRYQAETNLIEEQATQQRNIARQQLQEQLITQDEFNQTIVAINQSSATRLQAATETRDQAIIATTEQANARLLELATERQDALNEVRVGAVTDLTSNFVNQLNELEALRNEDLINAEEYVARREEIERGLNEALVLASNQSAEALTGNLTGVYEGQVQEALAFATDRLEALRGAYSEDAALAAAAFEEQAQLLEVRRANGTIGEDAYRAELEAIQTTYYARVEAAEQTYQAGVMTEQGNFNSELIALTRERREEIRQIEEAQVVDLTTKYEDQLAQLEELRNQGVLSAEDFTTEQEALEAAYQANVAEVQRAGAAAQLAIDQDAFAARTDAARTFTEQNAGTFDAVYEAQVDAISNAANAQQGILEGTNARLLSLGRSYNEQSIAENEAYTARYVALVEQRSNEITGTLDSTIVDLSAKFEQDAARLAALRDQDVISAEEYAASIATLQANLQADLTAVQDANQTNVAEILELSFQEQLQAADLYNTRRLDQITRQREAELQAAENAYTEQVALADQAYQNREITDEEYNQAVEAATAGRTARIEAIEAAYRDQTLAEDKRFTNERASLIKDYLAEVELAYEQDKTDLSENFSQQLAELTRLRTNDLISAEEYAARRAEIEEELEDGQLQAQLRAVQARLSVAEAGTQEYLRLKQRELSIQNQILDGEVEAVETAEKTKQELIQETRDAQAQALDFVGQALGAISSEIERTAEGRIAAVEEERDAILQGIDARREDIEANFEATQRAIENENLTEEQKNQRLQAAEARKEERLAQLDQEATAEEEKAQREIEAEEQKIARIQDAEQRLQAFRDLITSIQLANDSIKALSATQAAATEIAAAGASAAAQGGAAVAKTAASVPFPANLVAIAGIVAAIATGISAVRRLFGSNNRSVAVAREGGLIEVVGGDVEYMRAGGESGLRRDTRRMRTTRRRRDTHKATRRTRRVDRGKRIAIGRPHNRDGSLGGGVLTELERGEWVVPVAGVDMFKNQLAWMTQQANQRSQGKNFTTTFPEELFPTKPSSEIRRYAPSASRPPVINMPPRYTTGYAAEGGEVLESLGLAGGAVSATDLDTTNGLLRELSAKLDILATTQGDNRPILSLVRLREAQASLEESETRAAE